MLGISNSLIGFSFLDIVLGILIRLTGLKILFLISMLLLFSAVDLLVKVGEVVDKLFDLDEKLMLEWIKSGAVQALDQPQEDSEQQPVFRIVPCVLEAAKQVHSENPEGLDVYMHVLQLLATVDDGI